jgi:hypothetical protein
MNRIKFWKRSDRSDSARSNASIGSQPGSVGRRISIKSQSANKSAFQSVDNFQFPETSVVPAVEGMDIVDFEDLPIKKSLTSKMIEEASPLQLMEA